MHLFHFPLIDPLSRSWRAASVRAGVDVTYGLFDVVHRAFDVQPHELQGLENMRRAPPPPSEAPDKALQEEVMGMLRASQSFAALEGSGMMVLLGLLTEEAALTQAGMLVVSNSTAEGWLLTTQEANDLPHSNRLAHALLFSRWVGRQGLSLCVCMGLCACGCV
jgi:hypothetical protein